MTPRRRTKMLLLFIAAALLVPATIVLNSLARFPAWRMAVGWSPEALASTAVVPPEEVASGLPVLSLAMDPADLHDPNPIRVRHREHVVPFAASCPRH